MLLSTQDRLDKQGEEVSQETREPLSRILQQRDRIAKITSANRQQFVHQVILKIEFFIILQMQVFS